MSFKKYDENGEVITRSVTIDCQKAIEEGEIVRVEQNHKDKVNINNIVRTHGIDLIAKTSKIAQMEYDENPNNDFHETMNMIIKAQESFDSLPSAMRKKFNNDPSQFMDFIHNSDNLQEGIEMGIFAPPPADPQPVQVEVINQETPPPEGGA